MCRNFLAAAALAAAAVLLVGCGSDNSSFTYDEAAHRAAVEAYLHTPNSPDDAWRHYQELSEDRCEQTGDDYEALVAAFLDDDQLESLRIDAEYVCPDKADDLQHTLAELGYTQQQTRTRPANSPRG